MGMVPNGESAYILAFNDGDYRRSCRISRGHWQGYGWKDYQSSLLGLECPTRLNALDSDDNYAHWLAFSFMAFIIESSQEERLNYGEKYC